MNVLEVRNVSKAYGGIVALNACSLNVPEGKISGLIGPNGSGKTTLFNVITGYEKVDSSLWLVIAVPVDFVCFVIIPNPISLSAHDFYLGQFPWMYLTYLAVLLSPLCYAALVKFLHHPRHKAVQQTA